jgi:hypothetical protein
MFEEMEMLIILIWSLHIVYMYYTIILCPTNMYKYYVPIKLKNK